MEESKGVWAVVVTAGGKFLGRLNEGDDKVGAVMEQWGSQGWVMMNPTYEYHVMMSPGPGGTVQRVCAALPLGACAKGVKVRMVPTAIIFFSDMEEEDQKTHNELVDKARELADTTHRAAGSGLSVAQEGDIPGLRGGPGFRGPGLG